MRLSAHTVPVLAAGSAPPGWQASAALLGLIYGVLHVVGPDHLGTIMSLSAAATPKRAFSVGALWSFGHTIGMVAAAACIIAAQRYLSIDVEAIETIGDYAIGAFMVFVGIYLFAREGAYISTDADGSTSLKACDCHGLAANEESAGLEAPPSIPELAGNGRSPKKTKFAEDGGCSDSKCLDEACPKPKESLATAESQWQNLSSVLLGVVQGVCCPMGLVGLVILTRLSATSMVLFFLVFLVVSTVGTGALALTWSRLVSHGAGFSTQILYRTSCGFTVLMGIAWLVANYYGVLEKLNYAQKLAPALLQVSNSTMQ